MSGSSLELNGIRVYKLANHGPELRSGRDAVDLIGVASKHAATFIAIPLKRLGDDFFDLRTQIAGDIAQKVAIYGAHVPIIGDISQKIAASKSLAAFVAESNRGHDLWFVENLRDLANRLAEYRGEREASR